MLGVYPCMETPRRIGSRIGLLAIAAMFGALLGFMGARASHTSSRVALVYTAPVLESTAVHADRVVIEAYIDAHGRVWNYRVISNGWRARDLSPEIKNSLIFTTYFPPAYMGVPVAAT